MVSITTKTGDQGQTGLANGQRVAKSEQVFEVIGTLDELNSWLGLVAVKLDDQKHKAQIFWLQDTLFYIGAELAQSPKARLKPAQLKKLEKLSQQLEASLPPNWTTQFVLPGGTELGAELDITRAVCRRAERCVVAYARTAPVSATILKFINRLSDYLFLLRSVINHQSLYPEKKFRPRASNY